MPIKTCVAVLVATIFCSVSAAAPTPKGFKDSPDYMSPIVFKAKVAMLSANKDSCTNENFNRLGANLLYHVFAGDIEQKQGAEMETKLKKVLEDCYDKGLLPRPGFYKKSK